MHQNDDISSKFTTDRNDTIQWSLVCVAQLHADHQYPDRVQEEG